MRERDRLILIGGVVVAVLVVAWMFWVSPERKSAATVHGQVATAEQTLSSAQSQLASAQSSKGQYASAYAALVGVGKAVPATPEVPSLIYEINQATATHNVVFQTITAAGGTGGSSSSGSSSSAAAATAGGFTSLPFTFTFTGTFFDLYHLLGRLQSFEVQTPSGKLVVTGRLLTILGATLVPGASSGTTATGNTATPSTLNLTGTITATAYVMPPAAAASASTGTPASTTPGSSTPTTATPAVIQPAP